MIRKVWEIDAPENKEIEVDLSKCIVVKTTLHEPVYMETKSGFNRDSATFHAEEYLAIADLSTIHPDRDIADAFIAGAEWQYSELREPKPELPQGNHNVRPL